MFSNLKRGALLVAMIVIASAGFAAAASTLGTDVTYNIDPNDPLYATRNHWTLTGSPYHLKQLVYVKPGATLTIDAGVVVASYKPDQGSLAVCRGAQIFVNGTEANPVIMTSAQDVNNWTGSVCSYTGTDPCDTSERIVTDIITMGNPRSGKWISRCNDWGNLTVMGSGYISASHYGGNPVIINGRANTKCPDCLNQKQMEGLTDPNLALYGGCDDDDDSGEIHYISLRYGGKVIGLANELNGLSMGAIGRETDVHHVEIMNNVDDGIETWGGTVNYKNVSIWNIGDDSFDFDEGWRGKAQFGLIVQGYSVNAPQGSGVGDNCFETDGAEDSDAEPVTTSTIYNFTVVGQPVHGDQATAWRDNARVQYRNCTFMDIGEKLVKLDNTDGDGAHGYGYNHTLQWADTWTTPAGTDPNSPCGYNAAMYPVQVDGYLAEISDCVFFNINPAFGLGDAPVNLLSPSYNNVSATNMPIQGLARGAAVTKGGLTMLPVIGINPLAANDALVSVNTAPNDGFFTPVQYRGGFDSCNNWLENWTATAAYGMLQTVNPACKGDLNSDQVTDFLDFGDFANNWLQ